MAQTFTDSSLTVMELSDPEEAVCIELEPMGDNSLPMDEEELQGELSGEELSDGLEEEYETDVTRTALHSLIGENLLDKGRTMFSIVSASLVAFGVLCIVVYPFLVMALQNNNADVWKLPEDLFIPRNVGIDEVLETVYSITGLEVYAPMKHHVGVRSQYKYNPWNCTNWEDIEQYEYSEYMSAMYYEENGHGYLDEYGYPSNTTNDHDEEYLSETEIRVRNWLSVQVGSDVHTSSIDIKKQVPSQIDAFNIPFGPSEDQADTATEKLEEGLFFAWIDESQSFNQDIKPGKYQWSHKCKVKNIPYYPSFETCRDVMKYWPDCFPDLPEEKYDMIVERKTKSENYWWEDLRESTDPRSGLKWRLTVTMEYETFAQALEGRTHPIDDTPESSLRIWSSEDGHGPWDPRIVSQVNKW
eukprot:CAMPEP_0206210828 /NCGR_PEP_ID=MMETSP0166-20121206/17771_1 /ASSEMBLY_ACC=CAM_ASM_000260 /TAXON_ID=95228 /ORGANISM="Vannella robusta, Strain DIVA3 518/3/11/1/6" /LENGTH=413 /DNA_ID=CAMNT_0053632559 /DNA_START=1730 /DNA_END=2970 /DNA_ORIENTATION=+